MGSRDAREGICSPAAISGRMNKCPGYSIDSTDHNPWYGRHLYPRTILELEDRFATEDARREYLMRMPWPKGFVCPRCGHEGGWSATRGQVVCQGCRYQASITAEPIFQGTHKPVRLWFRAIWQVTSQKNGALPQHCDRRVQDQRPQHIGVGGVN